MESKVPESTEKTEESELAATPLRGQRLPAEKKCSCFLCSPCPLLGARNPNSGPSHIHSVWAPDLHILSGSSWRLLLRTNPSLGSPLVLGATGFHLHGFGNNKASFLVHTFWSVSWCNFSYDPTGSSSCVPLLSLVFLSAGHTNGPKVSLHVSNVGDFTHYNQGNYSSFQQCVSKHTNAYMYTNTHMRMNIYPFPLTLYPQEIEEAI